MRLDALRLGRLTVLLLGSVLSAGVASAASAQSGRDLDAPWGEAPRASARERSEASPPADGVRGAPEAPASDGVEGDVAIPAPPAGAYGGLAPPGPSASAGLRLPSTISTRVRSLESDLAALAQRGSGYIVDGVVQLLSSGVSIAVGVLFLTAGSGTGDQMAAYLFSISGVGVARGLLTLFLPVTPHESAVSYLHPTPLTGYREARDRLRAREGELHSLSDAAMVGRVVDGSLGIASAAAMIPLFAAFGFRESDPYSYVMLLLAGVSVVTGAITLFSTSDAERRWSNYVELRDRLAVTATGAEDERWLEEHAADEELASASGGWALSAEVGLLGGSLRLSF
jgi:hypothetical protein